MFCTIQVFCSDHPMAVLVYIAIYVDESGFSLVIDALFYRETEDASLIAAKDC